MHNVKSHYYITIISLSHQAYVVVMSRCGDDQVSVVILMSLSEKMLKINAVISFVCVCLFDKHVYFF